MASALRKLIVLTQRIDPEDPVLGATVSKVRALAARADELVVLCDAAVHDALPANVRVHEFGARTQVGRGARFEAALARELSPRPDGVFAHMVPLFAVLAAPLVRPLRIPLVLWYTHWKAHSVLRAADRVSTAITSVDPRSYPLPSSKLHAIGHGIDVSEFPCSNAPDGDALQLLVLGRYSPAKGLEQILRGVDLARERGVEIELEAHGTDAGWEDYRRSLDAAAGNRIRLDGPIPHDEVAAAFARSHALVNNMRAGAPDKVVYEAAAACLPVLASNPVFDELLPAELRFERERPETLAERLVALDRRRRPELREAVRARHSVDTWADGIIEAVQAR
jgi:glycosyltransferase involved in cell wall biosynthesis